MIIIMMCTATYAKSVGSMSIFNEWNNPQNQLKRSLDDSQYVKLKEDEESESIPERGITITPT